ncbi:MAG: type II secretion system protein [Bacilli bacterium]|nr:type II secretion system protein [Bacilli bacterium]
MKNKNAFTLIEVLAVIVIISVLLLLAVPEISGLILKSRRSASKDSTINFLKEFDNYMLESYKTGDSFEDGYYIIKDLNVDLNKKNPTDRSWIYVEKGIVDSYAIEYNNFVYVMGEDKKPKLVDGDFPIYKSKYDSCDLDETFVDCVTSRLNNDGLTSISQPVTTQMKATNEYRYSTGSSYCEYIMDGKTDVYESTHDENYKIVYDKEECTNLGGKYIENVKNYVLFDNQLYRVIGVFETKENETSDYKYKVKLIKDFPLTKDVLGLENLHPYTTEYVWYYYLFQRDFDFYKFDTKNTNGDGYFPTSFINNKLNNEYLSSLDDQSKNMIDDNLWYLGGALNNLLFPDGFYQQERSNNVYSTNSINYVSKIGLPYVSDIGYASDPDYWNGENLRICREFENSWIVNGSEDFTITPNIVDNSHVFAYGCHYYINTCLYGVNPNGYANIRPTFYLDENVKYKSGNGTYNHPYIIEM